MNTIYKKSLRKFVVCLNNTKRHFNFKTLFYLLLILLFNLIPPITKGNINSKQDEIEYIEGDYIADITGNWADPMIWREFDGVQFGEYGASGVPGAENTAYINGITISCDGNHEINNLILLPQSEIRLENAAPIIFSIFGNLKSFVNTLINSTTTNHRYILMGQNIQYLEILGNLGTNTHLYVSGAEVLLNNDLNLNFPSSTIRVEGGTLNFNHHDIIGQGIFRLVSGTLKITSPDGVNPKVLPEGADPTLNFRGNVKNIGTRDFDQASTFWYIGTTEQITGYIFGVGSTAKNIIIDNPSTVKLSISTGIGPQGSLMIKQGIFEETNEAHFNGTGKLYMETGAVYRTSLINDVFPKLSIESIEPESTFELAAMEGTQTLKGEISYKNLTFSGGGIKRITSATEDIVGTVAIHGNAILDVENKSLGGTSTNFTMTGGVFRTAKLNDPQPRMDGEYNLTGGTVEFYGTTTNNTQTLRGGKTYHNVNITATAANVINNNVSYGSGLTTITGVFKVIAPAVFQIGGALSQYIIGPGSFIVEDGATLKYGNAKGITIADCGSHEDCGNIRTAGRTFSENASYGFVGSSIGMVMGNGLPSKMKNLYINRANPITLSHNIEVEEKIIFSGTGNLYTNNIIVTLSSNGRITEIENARLIGKITTTRNVEDNSDFGGIGFEILDYENTPGLTTVTRTTGIPVVGDEENESILRYFEVQPSGEDINATIRFRYFTEELNDISAEHLLLFQSDALDGQWDVLGGNVVENQNSIVEANVYDFNFITAASSIRPLPVEIVSFTGRIDAKGAKLIWTTASERDNDFFTLEKSKNNIDFDEIATIPGSGNSITPMEYAFIDIGYFGSCFYRLKQTDFNGIFSYTEPIYIKNEATFGALNIIPNPVQNVIKISLEHPSLEQMKIYFSLYDSYGKQLISAFDLISTLNLALNDKLPELKSGIYIIMVKTDKRVYKEKFIRY